MTIYQVIEYCFRVGSDGPSGRLAPVSYTHLDVYKRQIFPQIDSEIITTLHKVPFYITLEENNNLILEEHTDPIIKFVHLYFQNFELIQHCISIYNTTNKLSRQPLRNTFAFITNDYNYADPSNNKPLRLLLQKYHNLTSFEEQSKSLIQHFFLEAINTTLVRYTTLTLIIQQDQILFQLSLIHI